MMNYIQQFVKIMGIGLLFISVFSFAGPTVTPANAETRLLVDFGALEGENLYNQADFPGWNHAVKGDYTTYGSEDGHAGTMMTSGDNRYDDHQGVTGPALTFQRGYQIVVTWYNTTDSTVEFRPLITVDDVDYPVNSSGEPQWHSMSKGRISPRSSGETTYEILSDYPEPKANTEGMHTVVNICLNDYSDRNKLICDKIEIRDIDTTPPSTPENLQVDFVYSGKIQLSWTPSTDNESTVSYFVYANGVIVGYSTAASHVIYMLEPDKVYNLQVQAMDEKRNRSELSTSVSQKTALLAQGQLIDPSRDIIYRGAFKLPSGNCELQEGDRSSECQWSYASGGGLAFNPHGDPAGSDTWSGSLFGLGYTKYASEITIPEPVVSRNMEDLNRAETLKEFTKIFYENGSYNDQAVAGLTFLSAMGNQTRDKLYYTRGHQHKASYAGITDKTVTHGLAHADLNDPIIDAAWVVGPVNEKPNYFSYHSIMFNIPPKWASANNMPEYLIATSGFRDGASPDGPGIIAVSPWSDQDPWPGTNTELSCKILLEYEHGAGIEGFHEADEWEGGAWLTTSSKGAVAMGTKKGFGEYWYGLPEGPEVSHFDIPSYPSSTYKSYKATRFSSKIVFYDPQDLAQVLTGDMQPYEPQPYAALDLAPFLYDEKNIRAMAFNRNDSILYLFESRADNNRGVIHVFEIVDHNENRPDVNGDGMVDLLDAMACINVILGIETDSDVVAAADINNDGVVNIQDVVKVVNYLLNV